jgi:outer membrane protein
VTTLRTIAACGLCVLGAVAQAHETGDVILRLGATTVSPNDDSQAVVLPTDPETVLPSGVSVDDNTQLGIIGTFMLNDKLGLELLAATPFEHDIKLGDIGLPAGSVTHLPPTLSLQWYPLGGSNGWQPYVGLGANYTFIYDESLSAGVKDVLGGLLGATTADLDLDDSVGWSAQAGMDVPVDDNWGLNLAVWYIDIGTTATISTDVGNVKFDVDIDPWVWNVGLYYRF